MIIPEIMQIPFEDDIMIAWFSDKYGLEDILLPKNEDDTIPE